MELKPIVERSDGAFRAAELANQPKFFDAKLELFLRDLRLALLGISKWPMLSWLWPKAVVRLYLPSGEQRLVCGGRALSPSKRDKARFEAIVLPDEMLLRNVRHLPMLQVEDVRNALMLEAMALSPFGPEDTVWGYGEINSGDSETSVELVIASRRQILKYLDSLGAFLKNKAPEVWVEFGNDFGYVEIAGFSDGRRSRYALRWQLVSAFFAFVTLTLLGVIAVTSSAQLYLRALKAQEALANLRQKVAPAIAQRDAMLQSSDLLDKLTRIVGKPISTLQAMDLISQVLPDDTSLTSLKIQGSKVSITGQTPNATSLMKLLGSTKGLKDVKAPTPAFKPLGATRESFTIEFLFDVAQMGSTI